MQNKLEESKSKHRTAGRFSEEKKILAVNQQEVVLIQPMVLAEKIEVNVQIQEIFKE